MDFNELTPEEQEIIRQRRNEALDLDGQKLRVVGQIKALMKEQQMTAEQLAKTADLQTYALKQVLAGKTDPRLTTVIRITAALGLTFYIGD
jgi:predicted transcriptional regulator